MRVNTTLREGHKLEKIADPRNLYVMGNNDYYLVRIYPVYNGGGSNVDYAVDYWHMNPTPVSRWVDVGRYDNYQDALTAFWNVYQLGLWKDTL